VIPNNLKTVCFLLKYGLFKPQTVYYYHQLQRQQYLSADEIEQINWDKRKRLLFHAYAKVPYYRDKFTSIGLHPADVKQPQDYCKVPLLQKDDIRQNFAKLISEDARPKDMRLSTTGGSTGEPLKVMFDKRVPLEAFAWRHRSWWDVPLGVNESVLLRMIQPKTLDKVINFVAWLPAFRVRLDASSMDIHQIDAFLRRFNQIHPQIVWGYVGAIDHVASFIEERGLAVRPPKAVWVTAAPLSEIQRRRIEFAFGSPVYEQYGCCEVFALSAQCKMKQAMHINHDARLIEFTDDSGNPQPEGTLGNVVLTDLENYCFPIIRYVNEDMGRALPSLCGCGINLPLMDKVKGRQSDIIRLPNKTCLAGEYLTTIFDKYPDAVKGFQVRQKNDYSIKIVYVPNLEGRRLTRVLEDVHKDLLDRTQGQVKIEFESVNVIMHDRGKLKFVVSEFD
jgi:phenylacetate-CoA ligase